MKVKVFTLTWSPEGGGFDDSAVEAFLAERTAIDVSEHFFVHEKTPVLVLVVTYRGGASSAKRAARVESRNSDPSDPSDDLTPTERQRYDALRRWRNQRAREVGRPPYAVFTNRQAVELVRVVPKTRADHTASHGLSRPHHTASMVISWSILYAKRVEVLHAPT